MRSVNVVFLILAGLHSISAFAADVFVSGRSYTHSCRYWTNSDTDLLVTYENSDLPWGVTVELVGGLEGQTFQGGGRQTRFEWARFSTRVMPASAPWQWQSRFTIGTAMRSSPVFYDGFNFVFKIHHPDGTVQWDKGSATDWAFYRVSFAPLRSQCLWSGDDPKPEFQELGVVRVPRA